ncbi:MAG TPA: FAD-dependent oxidoreductase, partial [Chthoniobacterales bacterium]
MTFDVAVAGLGGMGSAVAAHCAARGATVIGVDQFGPAHEFGASHGKSRMIRQAYFEDPAYVPLVLRAYELWRKLERDMGEELLRLTGVLSIGPADSDIISGTLRAADRHDLLVKAWSKEKVQRRYPTLQLQPDEIALFEAEGG